MPVTRDRYKKNPLSGLIQPKIKEQYTPDEYFKHDKLNISDIEGAQVDTHGHHRRFVGGAAAATQASNQRH